MADQGTEGLLSPYLRNKRLAAVAPYLSGRVLDFGCGSGALASMISYDRYLGVEVDATSLQKAQSSFPQHQFFSELPGQSNKFDTIVALAVIEHVKDPVGFLRKLAAYLDNNVASHIVITTPHPCVDWIHYLGSMIGLFSKHANEEHEGLLSRRKLEQIGNQAELKLDYYSRFLFGANQLAIYKKKNYASK